MTDSILPQALAAVALSPGRRILVAEDNAIAQLVIQRMLENDGHDVVFAANGDEAAKTVRSGPFDLVLMDIEMPHVSGLEATREIRALGGDYVTMPIVALTAHSRIKDRAQYRDAGMNAHLAKPVDADLLRRTIAALTNRTANVVKVRNPVADDDADMNVYLLLELFDGDAEAVLDFLEAAETQIDIDKFRIENAAFDDDTYAVAIAAHRLAGTSGCINAQRPASVSSSIEMAARENSIAAIWSLLDEFRAAMDATSTAIASFATNTVAAQKRAISERL